MNPLLDLEQLILIEGREWTRGRLEAQAQKAINELGAVCPKTGEPLQRRKRQRLKLITASGVIILKTWRGYAPALGRWVNPARELWGLKPQQRTSPELQSRLGFTAANTGSYQKAALTARRWGTPISDDTVHAVVQQLGAQAQTLNLPPPERPCGEPEFSIVLMMDGWMVRERGQDWSASPRRTNAQRVSWKEIKSAVIYRLEQRVKKDSGRGMLIEKYVVACPPETPPVDFGAAVQSQALRRGLGRAKKVYVVMDGAVWLWDLARERFSEALLVLDFHHASEHLWAIAPVVHGEGTDQAREWVQPLLHRLRHGKEGKVIHALEELLLPASGLNKEVQASLQTPVAYFQTHREHIHYDQIDRQGGPIGSGSVESLCSQLQNRFKRTGQFWSRSGLTNLLSVDVLLRNQDFDILWN